MYTTYLSDITLLRKAALVCMCLCGVMDGSSISQPTPPVQGRLMAGKIMYLALIKHYLSDTH